MKRKTIALVLCLCLLAGTCLVLSSCDKGIVTSMYDDADKYSTGAFTYDAALVKSITIEWYSGAICVLESDSEMLSVAESGTELDEAHRLHYFLREDGALFIRFWASGLRDNIEEDKKQLTVELPAGVDLNIISTTATIDLNAIHLSRGVIRSHSGVICAESIEAKSLDLSSMGGAIAVSSVTTAETLTVTSVSGAVSVNSIASKSATVATSNGALTVGTATVADKCRLSTVSGSMMVTGVTAASLDVHTASGDARLGLAACAMTSVETVSGNVHLSLPAEVGTTVYFETDSGEMLTERLHAAALGGGYHFGVGERVARVETKSGNLHIE